MASKSQTIVNFDVDKLTRLLEQNGATCSIVEDDRSRDHFVLKIELEQPQGLTFYLDYENQGFEPRIALLDAFGATEPPCESEPYVAGQSAGGAEVLKLRGRISEDPEKLWRWIAQVIKP
jgi:hypothetical protein